MKGRHEEDRLNQIKNVTSGQKIVKCWQKLELINLPIWKNLSEKACTSDLKLLKAQTSLIKGTTAVEQVINDLISEPDLPPKGQTVNILMDGVLLIANANEELNQRRREALEPALHSSYSHLRAPANLITSELFGDDLPKAVNITDTNRITSKLSRKTKEGFSQSKNDGHSERYHHRFRSTYSAPPKEYRRLVMKFIFPFF